MLGGCRVVALFRRLGKALAQFPELVDLFGGELGIAICEVRHRLTEPFLLMLGIGTHDSTPHDMLEQLVTGFFERRRRSHALEWSANRGM